MARRAPAVLIILALSFGLVSLIAPGAAARDRTELFLAKLQGFKEIPGPGDPDGSGKAYITLVGNRVCWGLNWFGIGAPTAAHIHIGRPAPSCSCCSPVLRCRPRSSGPAAAPTSIRHWPTPSWPPAPILREHPHRPVP
jgi:hypothetical protein